MRALTVVFTLLYSLDFFAQPATEIHLIGVVLKKDKAEVVSRVNISSHPGYDNQPHFTPDGKAVLFASIRDSVQADIYRYDLLTEKLEPLTCTKESEFSPVTYPSGEGFSVVRVEADSAQHLRFYQHTCNTASRLIEQYDSIGYYTWLNEKVLALFVLGEPHYLVITGTDGQPFAEFYDIGRSLHRIPGTESVSFVWKKSETAWWLCSLDQYGSLQKLAELESPYEDYCWLADGRIAWARGSTLLIASPDQLNTPQGISIDLSGFEINNITRVVFNASMDRFCVVGAE